MSGECDECGECPFECLCGQTKDMLIGFNIHNAIKFLLEASSVESDLDQDIESLRAALYFITRELELVENEYNDMCAEKVILGPPCQYSTARCIL